MSTKAELFPGESILSFIHQSQHRKLFASWHKHYNQSEAVPTFRGNGNTIIVGDSQTSPLPIFSEGGGKSVHRLKNVKLGNSCRSRAATAKKCTKKRDARANLLFCQFKLIAFLSFSLTSPSSFLSSLYCF